MSKKSAIHRLGAALQCAARRYGETLRTAEHADLSSLEMRSLLARAGLPADAIDPSGSDRAALPAAVRDTALMRLRIESRRLARLARARHPAYDLNRHIAVRRLLTALDAAPKPAPTPSPPSRHCSDRKGQRTLAQPIRREI
ncbi:MULTISPECIES: hypothetical protein [unclassified Aureimonas]|uniref:hypothetical protein n=1 Tax=unclassified Aureimonas TaxID=2615206 RepID=UPI0006FB4F22|nr:MULTISPECIES: hypothetical protein [unclassified Aureimonas]KQT55251.1 hypothetical protein ASG62_10475 [Aureimonas sp. Leaf427]KQT71042.1 hypothetical protein ASG54_20860 [Aureimonas sp. Leaf460]